MSELKKCNYCGNEIQNNNKFCTHCGAKNKKEYSCGGCLLTIFVAYLIFNALGSNRNTYHSKPSYTQTTSNRTYPNAVKQQPQEKKVFPGEMVNDEHFDIYYLSCSEYGASNFFDAPTAGKKYVEFDFTFKNISTTDTYIGSFECYCNNAKCDESWSSNRKLPRFSFLEEISGGRELSGSVVYEVPQDAILSDIELEYGGFSDRETSDKIIFVGQ